MLIFHLKKEWFDLVKYGQKTHEYRKYNNYWLKRIKKHFNMDKNIYIPPLPIEFCLGYPSITDTDKRIRAEVKKIRIVDGKDTDLKYAGKVFDIEFELLKPKIEDRLEFRLYDKHEKEMRYEVYATDYDLAETNNYRFALMQSTGLRDIKYKLIYEGDIVEILSKPKKVGVVVWRQNDCRYFVFKEYKFLIVLDIFLAVKVIGNIWENKELLEVEK